VSDPRVGHAFISYVRQDSGAADQLQQVLEDNGIQVWRDTDALWPGQDWRAVIRRAITDDALAFLACFSSNSVNRDKSYQYEELNLAIDQLRQRRPGVSWLIPVRFDECAIPDFDLGGGRTLSSIQQSDLFGDRAEQSTARLVAVIQHILGRPPA
jgi:TIR domain